MEQSRHRWHFVKEDNPLWYSVLLNDFYDEVHRYCLNHLDHYTEWIKPHGWCHKVILKREQNKHLTGVEPPLEDVERPSESSLHSHRAAYKTAKQSGTGKTLKKARSTLLETLTLHGLEEEYYYIIGGEKGPPPKVSEMVPMEVCNEAGAAASQGGGDAPLGCKHISWEEQVWAEEEWVSTGVPRRELPPPPQWGTASTSTPSVSPSTDDDGFIPAQGWKSQDKRPRDPSKDPTPRQRPSKASWSPLPFPLSSEAERVANVHTIFKMALNQTRPSSKWVYDHLETYFPHKSGEQLVYFSNVLCLSITEFHLTSGCTPLGMCSSVMPPVVELPPFETYLHDQELGMQDVCMLSEAAIKWLGVWLYQVDMTVRYNEARANSLMIMITSWAPSSIISWWQRTWVSV